MGAVWVRVRADLRRGWRSWTALAVITGMLGGIVIAAFAGARRTDRAYDRFLVSQHAYQQFMFTTEFYKGTASLSARELATLPTVETVVAGEVFDGEPAIVLRGADDDRLDRTLNVVNLLRGRMPNPNDPNEILVPELLAEKEHLHVGSVRSFTLSTPDGPRPQIEARVTGIGIAPGEFPPENDIGTSEWVHVTPAFVRRYASAGSPFAYVFLRRGDRDLPVFGVALAKATKGAPIIGYQQASLTKNVKRAFHLQAASLALLGIMLGATALALIAQSVSRATWVAARDHPVLSALGMSREELAVVALVRVGFVALGAVLVALALAYGLSPLSPTGRARIAVVRPGFFMDGPGFAIGLAALFVVTLGASVVPAFRSARVRAVDDRSVHDARSRVADAVQGAGAPASTSIGMRFALERGRGVTATPTRVTIFGAAIALAAISMTLTFGDGLRYLLHTPRLYGSVYELNALPSDSALWTDAPGLVARLRAEPGIADATQAAVGIPFRVNGVPADAEGIDADARTFLPPLLKGRYARAAREIVLGPGTLRAIRRAVGDHVDVSALGTASIPFTIVGEAVIPTVGHTANLGEGSLVSIDAVRALFPDDTSMGNILVKLRPGASIETVRAAVARDGGRLLRDVTPPLTPGDLVNFGGQRNLPFLLASILTLMAAATIAHASLASIARRRRDLAVLKATGFTSAQTRSTVAWQASTLVIAGLIAGVPVGIVAGRWLWLTYARHLGVIPEARVPVALLLLTIPAGILLANVVAWFPGRRAAHISAAVALRTE